jgi:hypothetical protein
VAARACLIAPQGVSLTGILLDVLLLFAISCQVSFSFPNHQHSLRSNNDALDMEKIIRFLENCAEKNYFMEICTFIVVSNTFILRQLKSIVMILEKKNIQTHNCFYVKNIFVLFKIYEVCIQ